MKFKKHSHDSHASPAKVGVLITNLGTPKAANARALRPYLRQFLSDPRVVEFPRWLWWCVLHFIILRIRPARAAKAYQKVWTAEGSPLAVHTEAQAHALKSALQNKYGERVTLQWAMRYGNPSIDNAIQALMDSGVQKLFVLPLYPQYSASTTASTFDAIADDFKQRRWLPELRFLNSYHAHSSYIRALADSIRSHWETNGRANKLMFSYHGIPLRYLHNGDPYHCFCLQTSRLVAEELGLHTDTYVSSFQSRFGREPWLQPSTDDTLIALAKSGSESVEVICPGFSADCLETLEEIDEENRHFFLNAGGKHFHYIPALNASAAHINALEKICDENIADWLSNEELNETSTTQERYNKWLHNRINIKD